MGTFGTGLPPGLHGLVGCEVLVPGQDRLLNELSWEDGLTRICGNPARPSSSGPPRTAWLSPPSARATSTVSGLTNAALARRYVSSPRVPLTSRWTRRWRRVRASKRALVYLYGESSTRWGTSIGCQSWEWGDELERIDGAIARLVGRCPIGHLGPCHRRPRHGRCSTCPAYRPRPRCQRAGSEESGTWAANPGPLQLYCEPGATDDVLATWRERVAARALGAQPGRGPRARPFGAVVSERVLPRIGDVIVAMRDNFAIVDSPDAHGQNCWRCWVFTDR
jgi:hypothetical protein